MQTSPQTQVDDKPLSSAHIYTIDEVMRVSDMFARSGYFKDAKTASQVFAKIVAGQELGVGPMTAMSMIHIIDGKATMDATLVGAQIKKSGRYNYFIKQSDEHACVLEFTERGKVVGESSFSMDDARRAGLASRMIWRSYPKDMLRSRAMTRGARMFCPDIFNGAIYTPEEIGAQVVVDDSGTMTVVKEPPSVDTEVDLHPAVHATEQRYVSSINAELVKEIYQRLGFDAKSRDSSIHAAAIRAVATALQIQPPYSRWSEFTITQLERYLETSPSVAQATAGEAQDTSTGQALAA